jgi:hypothetical protein
MKKSEEEEGKQNRESELGNTKTLDDFAFIVQQR